VEFKSEAEPIDMKTPKSRKSHKSHTAEGGNQFLATGKTDWMVILLLMSHATV
jgi:hypothetical protein